MEDTDGDLRLQPIPVVIQFSNVAYFLRDVVDYQEAV